MSVKTNSANRIIASLLAAIMVISMLPLSMLTAFAEEPETYVITVTSDGTTPIEGADVKITAGTTDIDESVTIANGTAEFTLNSGTEYSYSVKKLGYNTATGLVNMTSLTDTVTLTTKPTVTVTGHVEDISGNPIKNASIAITGYASYNTTTDTNGDFSVIGVYSGEDYNISASYSGYKTISNALNLTASNDFVLQAKESSELSFEKAEMSVKYGTTGTNTASCAAGSATKYESLDDSIATVNETTGVVTPVGIGSAVIRATINESDNYFSDTAEYTVTVEKVDQADIVWVKSIPTSIAWNQSYANTVSGGTGTGAVSYQSNHPDIASVDAATGVLTIKKIGSFRITATKAGGTYYNDKSVFYNLTIAKSEQEAFKFVDAHPSAIYYGNNFFVNTATGGSTSEAIVYSSSDTTIADVDANGKLTVYKDGDVTISATRPGNELYKEAKATYQITIYRADQVAEFKFDKGSSDRTIACGEVYSNAASGGGVLYVAYESSNESVAKVDANGTITALKSGETTITATDTKTAKIIQYKLIVNRANQALIFEKGNINIPAITYGDSYQNTVTGAMTDVTYTSSNNDVATVNSHGKLTLLKSGDVMITATAKPTEQYNEESISYTIRINKAEQHIIFEKGIDPVVTFNDNNNTFVNIATSDKGITDCEYKVTSGDTFITGFEKNAGSFTVLGAGSVTVNVTFAQNDCYNEASESYTLTVNPVGQSIAFPATTYTKITGEDFDAPEATPKIGEKFGTGIITYSIKSDENGVVKAINAASGAITLTYKAGTVTILATKASDANYKETTAEYSLTVNEWIPTEKYYELSGNKLNDSGWFTGNVSVNAKEDYLINDINTNGDAKWEKSLVDAVTTDKSDNSIQFYVKDSATGYISKQYTEIVKKDSVAPSASIEIESLITWEKFLTIISFGTWKKDTADFSIVSSDETSGVKSVEYCIVENNTPLLSKEKLDDVTDWKEYNGKPISIAKDKVFVVYAKVTDTAGNYVYASTNGVVFDATKPTADVSVITSDSKGFYKGDVEVRVTASDAAPYSGIDSVEYWVTCDETETQREVLFDFNILNPTHDQLVPSFKKTVTVNAEKNNSDNVKLYITVTDNAGNTYSKNISLKIDATPPTIDITYDVNTANVVVDRGYFKTNRTATIVIKERTTTFDPDVATAGIKITAKNAKGELADGIVYSDEDKFIVDNSSLNIQWITKEGTTPDDATHTATINYTVDANYTFEISYTDKADNANTAPDSKDSVAPYVFTIDKLNPTAEISIGTNKWNTLLNVLTFGLYSKNTVYVSATANDVTSPCKIEYYKTSDALQKTKGELDAATDWSLYNSQIEINDDEQFVVYLKVTDNAGNYIYINSDGYIVDMTEAEIKLTPDEPVAKNEQGVGIYNTDVNVKLEVNDQSPYAGLKKVEYWVLCNGKETKRESLFDFKNTTPTQAELVNTFSKDIKVDCVSNNSSDVVLHVGVTDNADNYSEKTLPVDIDIIDPTISVLYDNNNDNKTENGNGYFPEARTATVVIIERTAHFDGKAAKAGIKITAKDINGKTVIDDCSTLIGDWVTKEPSQTEIANGATPDNATHTATINYSADANYTFAISYTGIAGNGNAPVDTGSSVTPYSFTVDKTAPTGTVTVEKLGTWDKLIEILTFGLWSRDTVSVSGTTDDVTSPIDSIYYYKTADTTAKTEQELSAIADSVWQEFKGFDVPASEQFTVYVRIIDYAGNVTYISTNGIIVDNVKPVIETIKPEITITPEQPVNGFYNSDVKVAVKVEEPNAGATNAYSGIKEIRYEVLNMGIQTQQGVLYSFDIASPTQAQLLRVWEKTDAIVVDKALNNSNDVVIKVYAVDNAENTNDNSAAIKIDITNPQINVSYDNNDGDTTFTDGVYFKANRTATIIVRERNFDSEKVITTLSNVHGIVPELSGWTKTEGTGNGDDTLYTATIVYSSDGDYTFGIKCTDIAGNSNDTVDYGDSLAAQKFTLDKTLPLVTVVYDNNESMNGNYYKAQRVATITVTEHNFETSRVKLSLKATDNGQESNLPTVGEWSSDADVHTLKITYTADSLYTFDFDYNDKAGNATADIAEQSFYIDKTEPVLAITKIVDESANNDEGDIGFVVTATDTNFDVFTPVLTAVVKNGDNFETKKLDTGFMTSIANGRTYTVTNIKDDGIYRISCTVVDKAGNVFSQVILTDKAGETYIKNRSGNETLLTFSVNRNGSTFEIDDKTAEMVKKYYIQNVEENVTIIEINTDTLKEYKATLNGTDLKEGEDYKVTKAGGNGDWMKYTYAINKSLFEKEGEYKIVVSSKDKAENDAFSDVKDATVNFVVDRTAPIVAVTGLATDGRYQVEKQTVTLIPTDDGGALKSLVVRMVDNDGLEIKELVNLEDKALTEALETGSGKIVFEIAEGLYQNVQILCNDCAVDAADKTNTYDETFTNVSVSSNAFMIFWANKPLRWASIGGIILLSAGAVTLTVLKKKKKRI